MKILNGIAVKRLNQQSACAVPLSKMTVIGQLPPIAQCDEHECGECSVNCSLRSWSKAGETPAFPDRRPLAR